MLGSIPGYAGYRDKERRRDADKAVRDRLVAELRTRADRVGQIASALADARRITEVGPINDLQTRIRMLSDRVNTASYGYGGLFGTRDVDGAVIDQLRLFDEALFAGLTKLDDGIAAVETAMSSKADASTPLSTATSVVQSMSSQFDTRASILNSGSVVAGSEVARVLDVLKTPAELEAANKPPAAFELHDRDALAILGDDYVVDARIDVNAGTNSFRLFRLSTAPEKWLFVPKGIGKALALVSPASGFATDVSVIEASGSGTSDAVGASGQSGQSAVAYTLLADAADGSKRAILLKWSTEQLLLQGSRVDPNDIEIFGKPA